MILATSYANGTYKVTQKYNSKRAIMFGADRVTEYTYDDLDEDFLKSHAEVMKYSKGSGLWSWKPYCILKALNEVELGDYVIYTDSGSAFVNDISLLMEAMTAAGTDIMGFMIPLKERCYTKRDAFVLLDCDTPEYTDTFQICGTYIIAKKTAKTIAFFEEYLNYCADVRIISDEPNVLGKPNYDDFIVNRHDQTIFSLLYKKHGYPPFRDPSEYGLDLSLFPEDVVKRSPYPQVIESHRNKTLRYDFQLKYNSNAFKRAAAFLLKVWDRGTEAIGKKFGK